MEVGLGPGDFVFDGDPALPQKKGQRPHLMFGPSIVDKRAGWIKMPLGTEVNLGPGDVVLDGVAALELPLKVVQPSPFYGLSVVAKGLDGSKCHLVRR